jgi:hypothetical protein
MFGDVLLVRNFPISSVEYDSCLVLILKKITYVIKYLFAYFDSVFEELKAEA